MLVQAFEISKNKLEFGFSMSIWNHFHALPLWVPAVYQYLQSSLVLPIIIWLVDRIISPSLTMTIVRWTNDHIKLTTKISEHFWKYSRNFCEKVFKTVTIFVWFYEESNEISFVKKIGSHRWKMDELPLQ